MTSRFASRSSSSGPDSDQQTGSSAGSSAFSQLSHAMMSIVQARLELIGIELAEEKDRLVAMVLLSVLAAMLGMLALIGLTALVVILLWDSYRWQPLAVMSAVYAVICAACLFRVGQSVRNAPPAFELTRAEFEQDRILFERRASRHDD